MAKKSEKASGIYKELVDSGRVRVGDNFKVKQYLNIKEQLRFTHIVCEMVVDENEEKYTPALMDFATRYAIAVCYSNLDIPANANTEDVCRVLYATEVIECIYERANVKQLSAMIEAAEKEVCFLKEKILRRSASDKFWESLSYIAEKVESYLNEKNIDDLVDLASRMKNMDDKEVIAAIADTMDEKEN